MAPDLPTKIGAIAMLWVGGVAELAKRCCHWTGAAIVGVLHLIPKRTTAA